MSLQSEDRLYVDMESYECFCTEKDKMLFGTKNPWEYYFDQIQINKEEKVITIDTTACRKILSYRDFYKQYQPDKFIDLRKCFFLNFKLKPYLQNLLDTYYKEYLESKITLGVHIRLTDMRKFFKVSSIEDYINKIKNILKSNSKIEQIFVATDDYDAISEIKNSINLPILYYEDCFRASKNVPLLKPYDWLENGRELHRYKLGLECIRDIFTLSMCNFLLRSDFSSISIASTILSENIEEIYHCDTTR